MSGAEIDAGRDKPEYHPRPFDPNAEKKPRKARVPKAPAVPRWKQLIADARFYLERKAIFPDPNAAMIQGLADELEGARAELSQFLPLKP